MSVNVDHSHPRKRKKTKCKGNKIKKEIYFKILRSVSLFVLSMHKKSIPPFYVRIKKRVSCVDELKKQTKITGLDKSNTQDPAMEEYEGSSPSSPMPFT